MRQFIYPLMAMLLISTGLFAQGFEGSIYFTKSNMVDVTKYAYHVKGNKVRIDEMVEGSEKLVAALLVDLESGEMTALSHDRKLYLKRPKGQEVEVPAGLEIKTGQLEKSISGRNCKQYRVKSRELDSEVSFWVTEGDFFFFPKLLSILRRKDNFSRFYLGLPDINGMFPMSAEEYTLLRDRKGFLQVDEMTATKLDDSLFAIPQGYQKVDK
jgi:hypothetical protein